MAVRQFVDAAGCAWEVFEVRRHTDRAESVSPGLEAGWLTFVSSTEKRRLPSYPDAWWSFDDAHLAKLCGAAHPAPMRSSGSALEFSHPARSPAIAARNPIVPISTARAGEPSPLMATSGEASLDERVRAHGRKARQAGMPAVQAMIALKHLLRDDGVSAGTAAFKRARRIFVDAFYFD